MFIITPNALGVKCNYSKVLYIAIYFLFIYTTYSKVGK